MVSSDSVVKSSLMFSSSSVSLSESSSSSSQLESALRLLSASFVSCGWAVSLLGLILSSSLSESTLLCEIALTLDEFLFTPLLPQDLFCNSLENQLGLLYTILVFFCHQMHSVARLWKLSSVSCMVMAQGLVPRAEDWEVIGSSPTQNMFTLPVKSTGE